MSPLRCALSPSTAKAFAQLSTLRPWPAPSSASILDILLPPRAARLFSSSNRTPRICQSKFFGQPLATKPVAQPMLDQPATCTRQARTFAASVPRRLTRAIHNPQKDDEGSEMLLEITPGAAKRLTEIMTKDANPHLALRIQVESGGCHGFQYLMSLVTLPHDADSLDPTLSSSQTASKPSSAVLQDPSSSANAVREDDTIFAYYSDKDGTSTTDVTGGAYEMAPRVVLDSPSLDLLKGSKVDFTMELIGSQFKIVDNPLATSSCGCGTSFDIKL